MTISIRQIQLHPINQNKGYDMLFEGLEKHDLKRLVKSELHIDEYKSEMGKDEDIVVISFKVTGKQPAIDLVNFFEKGYDWVIDADVSSGELDDGDFLVFLETDRDQDFVKNVIQAVEDVNNLTDYNLDDWRVQFRSNPDLQELNPETILANVPLTSENYLRRFGNKELDEMRTAAGIPVHTHAPKNDYTQSIKSLAGII